MKSLDSGRVGGVRLHAVSDVATAMYTESDSDGVLYRGVEHAAVRTLCRNSLLVVGLVVVATGPVLAQSGGAASFCGTQLADTIKNVFSLIQFGGPLIGGTLALGAVVAMPVVRRSDRKLELKEMRNQAIIWGVIVAPLASVTIAFILNNIVAGGSSCSF